MITGGALDNIDQNSQSTTAEVNFHGTGVSLFQMFGLSGEEGQARGGFNIIIQDVKRSQLLKLPSSYKDVPPQTLRKTQTW